MSWTKSLSMIIPTAKKVDCNRLMAALGRGSNTFIRDLSPSGARAETHHGAHTFDDALLSILQSGVVPVGPNWEAHGLTAVSAQAALNAIKYSAKTTGRPRANLNSHASSQGLKLVPKGA